MNTQFESRLFTVRSNDDTDVALGSCSDIESLVLSHGGVRVNTAQLSTFQQEQFVFYVSGGGGPRGLTAALGGRLPTRSSERIASVLQPGLCLTCFCV